MEVQRSAPQQEEQQARQLVNDTRQNKLNDNTAASFRDLSPQTRRQVVDAMMRGDYGQAVATMTSHDVRAPVAIDFVRRAGGLDNALSGTADDLIRRGQYARARDLANQYERGEINNIERLRRWVERNDTNYLSQFDERVRKFDETISKIERQLVPHPLHNETALAANTQARLNQLAQQAAAMDLLAEERKKTYDEITKKEEKKKNEEGLEMSEGIAENEERKRRRRRQGGEAA